MNKKVVWSVVSANAGDFPTAVVFATFLSLEDALEYAAWVTEYDEDVFYNWTTYIVVGDFVNV